MDAATRARRLEPAPGVPSARYLGHSPLPPNYSGYRTGNIDAAGLAVMASERPVEAADRAVPGLGA